jgi:hypothetical protein
MDSLFWMSFFGRHQRAIIVGKISGYQLGRVLNALKDNLQPQLEYNVRPYVYSAQQLRIMRIIIKALGINGNQEFIAIAVRYHREAFADAKLLRGRGFDFDT